MYNSTRSMKIELPGDSQCVLYDYEKDPNRQDTLNDRDCKFYRYD